MPNDTLPEWEQVLSSAAHLQRVLPDAALVGGTAAALYADHRISLDADHVLSDLHSRFDTILSELESVAGWKTARIKRPVLILGSLDGIETGIRQLIREQPLETSVLEYQGNKISVPTEAEILRIKAVLILKRNATRDYLDFAALSKHMGKAHTIEALRNLDRLYPQSNGESVIQQLQIQLANPLPYDLEGIDLSEYRNLKPHWQTWSNVRMACADIATTLFSEIG